MTLEKIFAKVRKHLIINIKVNEEKFIIMTEAKYLELKNKKEVHTEKVKF